MRTPRQDIDSDKEGSTIRSVHAYIGQRIRERRKLLNMNQAQLGRLMGFSYQQIQKYENGQSDMSVSKLLRFAKILSAPPEYFYEGARTGDETENNIGNDRIPETYSEPLRILLVESNPHDIIQFMKAMRGCKESIDVHVLHDTDMVNDFLHNHQLKYGKAEPDVIILDVNLPHATGMNLLKWIKKHQQLMAKPVLVLTNSTSRSEMQEAYRQGAAGFIQKRALPEAYGETMQSAMHYWASVVALPRA